MKQVCVIGNSHLAAIKLGWDVIAAEYPEIKLTFFGSPQSTLRNLRVENGALVPGSEQTLKNIQHTSGGESKIVADRFDAFLIVALEFNIGRIVTPLYENYRSEEHANPRGAAQYMSNACFAHAAKGCLQRTLALRIARNLKNLADRRIVIVPQPFPDKKITVKPLWEAMVDHGDHLLLARSFARISSELTDEGKCILQQPDETKESEIFTKRMYSEGAARLLKDIKQPDDDFLHMNPDYGATVLRGILPSL